ncbi:MAG: hypothetical protein QW273_00415 [Candidatus Pacearchaeota archaeon]
MKKALRLIFIFILGLFFLSSLFFLFYKGIFNKEKERSVEAKTIECLRDSDCLIIRGSCCPCEEGGSPICIPKTELTAYTKIFDKCSEKGKCLNSNCGKISCSCIDNKCVGKK